MILGVFDINEPGKKKEDIGNKIKVLKPIYS